MNQIVSWACQWPDADVNPITLFAHQANGDNKIRRNRLYQQFGIVFDFADSDFAAGVARPMRARQLTPWRAMPANLTVLAIDAFMDEQQARVDELLLANLTLRRRHASCRDELSRAIDHPVAFTLTTLWYRHSTALFIVAGILMLLLLYWLHGAPKH
ncbi:hypothetical protein [Nguyenibacter sp. L1]|uniref:hypothetical protein n=1 Tax=Nguyenibacter sp. L1 TaxID=3049350 RepID=UPI002B4642F7|nr:hypothetical protein [Nguyenibacter sp. L1]WRH86784.1 hypothetical protein QN315_12265 [Nguyenibacter sp. L1]